MIRHVAHMVQVKPNFILQVRPLSRYSHESSFRYDASRSAALNDALRLFYALITILGKMIAIRGN